MFQKKLCLCFILILLKPYYCYVQGIIEHSTPSSDEMIFIHNHHDNMDAESYEDKILRARAYVNVLSMSSDDHHFNQESSLSSSSSSKYMYGPIEPFDHRNNDNHHHHNNVRFEWMYPFELYECNME